jgi:DNA-binding NtrC family response regulator
MDKRLIIVEDEETLCASLKRVLSREGYAVDTANSSEAALGMLGERPYDLIITDIILPGMNGIELLRVIREKNPEQIVVVMTAYASLETAVEALRAGAYDYIVKPVMHEEIKQIVRNAIRQKTLQRENVLLKCQLERHYDIETISIYRSPLMQGIINDMKRFSDNTAHILVTGDAGTEKGFIAKVVHMSSRPQKPFIPLKCNTLDLNSFRSSLDDTDGGILFLDDLLCLNAELQELLLKALDGADFRIISATSSDGAAAVQRGELSGVLYHKINGMSIKLPPLKERIEDIEPLANYFIQKYSEEFCKNVRSLDRKALQMLKNYSWPGNTRELQNVIERAVLVCRGEAITEEHVAYLSPAAPDHS